MITIDDIVPLIRKVRFICTDVTASTNLYTDLGFDSVQFIHFLCLIENEYGIVFDLMEMQDCLIASELIYTLNRKIEEMHR